MLKFVATYTHDIVSRVGGYWNYKPGQATQFEFKLIR